MGMRCFDAQWSRRNKTGQLFLRDIRASGEIEMIETDFEQNWKKKITGNKFLQLRQKNDKNFALQFFFQIFGEKI